MLYSLEGLLSILNCGCQITFPNFTWCGRGRTILVQRYFIKGIPK